MRIWGTNIHILFDSTVKKMRERELKLQRKLTQHEIEGLMDDLYHIRRNPKRKAA